jgi:hypothetical protein
MLTAASLPIEELVPEFRAKLPEGSQITNNFGGYLLTTGSGSQGMTRNAFPEYVVRTHFNLKYVLSVSDTIRFETFQHEKLCFPKLTSSGGESHIIMIKPLPDEHLDLRRTQSTVRPTSVGSEYATEIDAD